MFWRGLFRPVFGVFLALIFALVLSGCASGIKTYDSTFTSAVPLPKRSSSAIVSAYAPRAVVKKTRRKRAKLRKPYFLEFRARNALTYGHASVVFGLRDKNGKVPVDKKGVLKPGIVEISGLHPASNSTVPWTIGHIIPVPAETGPSDGDFEDAYVTARYRIDLTEKQFRKVVAVVAKHKRIDKVWFGPLYACTHYINAIAKDLGLKVPSRPYLPKNYVNKLKELNGKARI